LYSIFIILHNFEALTFRPWLGTVENHGKNGKKHGPLCENGKNHGKITAVYIVANLLKLRVYNSREMYILGQIRTTMMSPPHILPVCNKAHGLW